MFETLLKDKVLLLIVICTIIVHIFLLSFLKPDKSSKYNKDILKVIFIYSPAALVTVTYFLSLIYLSAYYSAMGVSTSASVASSLNIAEAGIILWVDNLAATCLICTTIVSSLLAFYRSSISVNLTEKWVSVMRVVLIVVGGLCVVLSPFALVKTIEKATQSAKKNKRPFLKAEQLSTIKEGEQVIAKGRIVAMNDIMVWIFDGKNTVAINIGNRIITTPVMPEKNEKTTN